MWRNIELSNHSKGKLMDATLEITKAVSDPSRLRALMALENDELCVCQIIELLKLAPSTVSKHMSILRQAGLIAGDKRGRWMYYRREKRGKAIQSILKWLDLNLGDDRIVKRDRKKLKTISCRNEE
jgi:ArsR family transcriptional regulator